MSPRDRSRRCPCPRLVTLMSPSVPSERDLSQPVATGCTLLEAKQPDEFHSYPWIHGSCQQQRERDRAGARGAFALTRSTPKQNMFKDGSTANRIRSKRPLNPITLGPGHSVQMKTVASTVRESPSSATSVTGWRSRSPYSSPHELTTLGRSRDSRREFRE